MLAKICHLLPLLSKFLLNLQLSSHKFVVSLKEKKIILSTLPFLVTINGQLLFV